MNCCKRGESKTEKAQIHYITLFMRLARKQREASFLPHFDQSLGESLKNGLFTVSLTVGVLRDHFEIRETTLFFLKFPPTTAFPERSDHWSSQSIRCISTYRTAGALVVVVITIYGLFTPHQSPIHSHFLLSSSSAASNGVLTFPNHEYRPTC